MMNNSETLQRAIEYLDAIQVAPDRYAYRDDATQPYYVVRREDLEALADCYDLVTLGDGARVPSCDVQASDLILVRSDSGDGSWSLHAPRTTDEAIAQGMSRPLISDVATYDRTAATWDRPDASDYATALEVPRDRDASDYDYSRWCADTQAVEMPAWWTPETTCIYRVIQLGLRSPEKQAGSDYTIRLAAERAAQELNRARIFTRIEASTVDYTTGEEIPIC